MEWEQRFCPDQSCSVDFWLVQQVSPQRELWRLEDRFGGGAFTVAATDPVCPRCGSTLCLIVDLAQRNGDVLEPSPMLEFVRSL